VIAGTLWQADIAQRIREFWHFHVGLDRFSAGTYRSAL